MVRESQYCQVKAKIPEIKQLFQARRYAQCAAICERYLARGSDEVHPLHKAYLHFYLALTYDTTARETIVKHRTTGLELAEQHYRAAITILQPFSPSPTSSASSSHSDLCFPAPPGKGHRASWGRVSPACDESMVDSGMESGGSNSEDESGEEWVHVRSQKRRPKPIKVADAARTNHEELFEQELLSFLSMVQAHLRGVRQMKAELTGLGSATRPAFSRTSTESSRASWGSSGESESEVAAGRRKYAVKWRPRFDPSGIQKLCSEALEEL